MNFLFLLIILIQKSYFEAAFKTIYRHFQYFATELTFTSTSSFVVEHVVSYMFLAFLWLLLCAQIQHLCTGFPKG